MPDAKLYSRLSHHEEVEDRRGSKGERMLQERFGTRTRAEGFYKQQMLDHLNADMQAFIGRMELAFVSTADGQGKCDCSIRAGEPGFVQVLDERTLAYPEYRGNGVMASLGNITENPHIGLLFVDFFQSTVGLHINGTGAIVGNEQWAIHFPFTQPLGRVPEQKDRQRSERWVLVRVEEAYIHCAKHIPLLEKKGKSIHWGTDETARKGGDYFHAKRDRGSSRR
jgi:predicted pyridoxine 5'-phosphate oxidase superfamily flavin-nucleotide-binding protein